LKDIDKSLVIDTNDETPVRQSRRIAQQKIREETERRQMEEKLLKQMKAEAEKKKKSGASEDDDAYEEEEEEQKDSSDEDQSFKESKRKKKSKIHPSDKQWQTSSSHSEHSESEDYMEHVPSDPGSPLFKSDHEFSPESDDDDTTQVQPVKRARTAKKIEAVATSDDDEDINPNHACQVCHKTDSPEWILLCDQCDCGYHW
jgi:remodeling and spacing factor 1